jgi:hypothetical protein
MVRNLIAFGLMGIAAIASLAAGRPPDTRARLAAVCADIDGALASDDVADELRMYIEGDVDRGVGECPKACSVKCAGGDCSTACAQGRAVCACKVSGLPLCSCVGCP